MQIDSTTVDVEDVIRRVQAVRRGELPDDAVSVEELRAAVNAQRCAFAAGAAVVPGTQSSGVAPKARKTVPKTGIVFNLSLLSSTPVAGATNPSSSSDDDGSML